MGMPVPFERSPSDTAVAALETGSTVDFCGFYFRHSGASSSILNNVHLTIKLFEKI
jgi:hypothetical protein